MTDAPARFEDLCLDAVDPQALADWGTPPAPRHSLARAGTLQGAVPLVDPAGAGPALWVNRVAERKGAENRMHHDVVGDTAALLALGATLVRARDDVPASDHDAGLITWDVLADPEGNESCCFAPG